VRNALPRLLNARAARIELDGAPECRCGLRRVATLANRTPALMRGTKSGRSAIARADS
jgi:hypothetical protein